MKNLVDLEYMRRALKEHEENLTVKTGVRAGGWDPPVFPPYGLPPDAGE
jgi:hypothetical protein